MGSFTDVHIRSWIKEGKPIAKSDGDGLTFTLSAKGTAAWILRYRHGGKAKELTLGRYPDIGLSDARGLATEYRARIQQGVDVAMEKRRTRTDTANAQSFRKLTEDYIEKVFPTLAANTVKQRHCYIKKDILPKIGALTAREVSPADIVNLVERVGKRSVNVADLVLTTVSEICKHGVAKRVLDTNPCAGISIKAVCGKAEPKRKRIKLTAEELAVLISALPAIGKQNELSVKILLATCTRIGELASAEWDHIDFQKEEWMIPDSNSKTRTGFIIPLVPVVVEWFKELKTLSCGSRYVLPARQSRRKRRCGGDTHFEKRTLNSMLYKICDEHTGKIRRFTPHDLRSTARSHLAQLGVSIVVSERCLNHSLGGLIAVYDQHDYMEERRKALGLLAEFLLKCENLDNPNVLQLPDRKAA